MAINSKSMIARKNSRKHWIALFIPRYENRRARVRVNTRPAGGGADYAPPLPEFLDSSKTTLDIDVKLAVPSPASICRLPPKFPKNLSINVLENGV